MYKAIIAIVLCVFILSCTDKDQAKNEKYILGNWVRVRDTPQKNKNGIVLLPPSRYEKSGFTFYKDHSYDYKLGYFSYDSNLNRRIYSGNTGRYKIKGDNLLLFTPYNKSEEYKLLTLNDDSLRFESYGDILLFKHYKITKHNSPEFDKIIVSASGCYGSCQAMDIMINANGNVLFNGKHLTTLKGWYTGRIPKDEYRKLQNSFRQSNFDSLKNYYNAGWTDDQTVCVSFIKDNKIYKSVVDYGRESPYLFVWAYRPVQYLYQTIKLNKSPKPDTIPQFETLRKYNSKRNDSIIRINDSEQFLLSNYLRNGKKTPNISFVPMFELTDFYNGNKGSIKTDGRYYSFLLNGKEETIDIGFNFFEENNKILKWVKPDGFYQ
ncbi:MAG: DUF6438 domain-containing protein [Mucilaginibacter sp.]